MPLLPPILGLRRTDPAQRPNRAARAVARRPTPAARLLAAATLLLTMGAAAGCEADGGWTPGGMEWDPESPEARAILAPPAADEPVDAEMAEAGRGFYRSKGCLGCHSVGGGDMVGPDLAEVTERREYRFFAGMVMNPDSMLRVDPEAQALLRRFTTPMPDQRVTELQTRAMWEYLRGVASR